MKKINYKKISLTPNLKYVKIAALLVIMMGCTVFLPDPLKDKAEKIHNVNVVKKEQIKKIEKVKKEVEKNTKLKDWQRKELNYKLSQLQNQIKNSKNQEEINKSIQKTNKKLEFVKKNYNKDNLNRVADMFIKNNVTKELGKSLKSGNNKAFEKAAKEISKKIKSLSKEQKKQLSQEYKNLAKQIKNNPQLGKAISNFAQSMESGDLQDITAALSNVSQDVSTLMKNEDFNGAVNNVQTALEDSLKNLSQDSGSQKSNSSGGT
ncbi:hypothetical protein ACFIJ5_17195 [Haloimpatiens sp. FM7330]|uniref:hypothetical protein n=1 Tax=Haloimpatiens sp. FM7330 TaxID=3298610 RepID=UPI003637DA6B